MKIATYNIQRGRGLDFARRIERAVAVLRSIDADIVALQEVVVGPTGDQAKTIADALGMQHRFAAARPHGGSGEYGLALLSRAAIGTVRPHDLSVPRCEPRIVLQAETLGVRVFVCHFGLGPRERARQAIRLRAILAEAPKPRVVLGDFNEWTHGAVAHALEAELGVVPRVKTHRPPFRFWRSTGSTAICPNRISRRTGRRRPTSPRAPPTRPRPATATPSAPFKKPTS